MADDFRFDVTSDDAVHLYWPGEPVLVLRGEEARDFLKRIEGVDDRAAQLELAKFAAAEIRDKKNE
jgi:hypothetical protein